MRTLSGTTGSSRTCPRFRALTQAEPLPRLFQRVIRNQLRIQSSSLQRLLDLLQSLRVGQRTQGWNAIAVHSPMLHQEFLNQSKRSQDWLWSCRQRFAEPNEK